MTEFAGKRVFVTGAGVGIGYAICMAFAEAGAIVALNDMDEALATAAVQKINEKVRREAVEPFVFDIADTSVLQTAITDFSDKHGGLDILVANAGITNYGSFLDYTPEAFSRIMQVNLQGSYFSAQAAAKAMIKNSVAGRILLMSSITGIQAFLNLGAYGITKAGIRMMAKSLALEVGEYGITVNAVSPGATLTERTLADDPGFEANWASVTPTGRAGYVEDVTATVQFLSSAGARHITGQTIQVDGGWTIHSPLPEAHPEQPEESSKLK